MLTREDFRSNSGSPNPTIFVNQRLVKVYGEQRLKEIFAGCNIFNTTTRDWVRNIEEESNG